MTILARMQINLEPNEFMGSQPPLTEEQLALAKNLFLATFGHGGWVKKRLAATLQEEMRFTSRHIGGPTQEQIEELLKGTAISWGEKKEEGRG